MSSIQIIKAMHEIDYSKELFNEEQYFSLETAIREISEEVKNDIFGEKFKIETKNWLKIT